jgi:hypothetical protein
MYTIENFKSGAALKRALKEGKKLRVYAPGLGNVPENGSVFLEGPHYPAPHTWYLQAEMKDGYIHKVK